MTRSERIVLALMWVIATAIFAALYVPAFLVVFQSFFVTGGQSIDLSTFGLQWYASLAGNEEILGALLNSLIVGIAAIAISMAVALLIAYYMKVGRRRGRRLVEVVIVLPFVLPPIITGISLLVMLRWLGVPNSLWTVLTGHAVLVLAILYRMVSVRLDAIEDSQIEASLDLGAGHLRTFFLIVLPQLRSAMITGGLLAFTMSFDETLVTFFLVGPDVTVPLRLWSMLRVGFSPEVNAFATLMLAATAALTVAAAIGMRDEFERTGR
jgi:ABC-type spermidine/putrescine transport system permease subunit II